MKLGSDAVYDVHSVGERFLLGKPTWAKLHDQKPWLNSAWLKPTHLFTVESVGNRELWARDQDGEIRRFELSRHLDQYNITGPDRPNIAWAGRLPNGSFDEIAAFAEAMLSEQRNSKPYAFFVKKVTSRTITANLICFADRAREYLQIDNVEKEGRFIDNAFVGNDVEFEVGDHDWAENSFVVAKGFSVRHDGDKKLVAEAGQIVRIIESTTIEGIANWLPDLPKQTGRVFSPSFEWHPLGTLFDYLRECDRGIARSEPNHALFYWYPDPTEQHPDQTATWVLGSEGIAFYDVDSLADYFYGENIEHGLWMIENAKWWTDHSCGDYDCGIEGDWRRATIADVEAFGFDISTLNTELASIREIDVDPNLAQTLLAMVDTPEAVTTEELVGNG